MLVVASIGCMCIWQDGFSQRGLGDASTSKSLTLKEARAVAVAYREFRIRTHEVMLDDEDFDVYLSSIAGNSTVWFRPKSLDTVLEDFGALWPSERFDPADGPTTTTELTSATTPLYMTIDDRGIGSVRCHISPAGRVNSVEDWSTTDFSKQE
jgi:hypothetical protein